MWEAIAILWAISLIAACCLLIIARGGSIKVGAPFTHCAFCWFLSVCVFPLYFLLCALSMHREGFWCLIVDQKWCRANMQWCHPFGERIFNYIIMVALLQPNPAAREDTLWSHNWHQCVCRAWTTVFWKGKRSVIVPSWMDRRLCLRWSRAEKYEKRRCK